MLSKSNISELLKMYYFKTEVSSHLHFLLINTLKLFILIQVK